MNDWNPYSRVCQFCSGPHSVVVHSGPCPRVKAIEYHPNGAVARVELHPIVGSDAEGKS